MAHPLARVPDDEGEETAVAPVRPEVVDPVTIEELEAVAHDVQEPLPVPVAQKTNRSGTVTVMPSATGPLEALERARNMAVPMVDRLLAIAAASPNHNAARNAARDVLQIAGVIQDRQRVDVVLSFRAIFQRMTADELEKFLTDHVFPDHLRDEALKLLAGPIGQP